MGDLYSVLGLTSRASDGDIKAAYRERVKLLHPDVNGAPDAEERIREVNQAYEVLGDRAARAAYNRALAGRGSKGRGGLAPLAVGAASFLVTSGVIGAVLWRQPALMATVASEAVPRTAVAEIRSEAKLPELEPAPSPPEVEDVPAPEPVPTLPEVDEAQALDESPAVEVPAAGRPEPPAEAPPEQVAVAAPASAPAASTSLPSVTSTADWATYRNVQLGFKLSYPADVFAETTENKEQLRTIGSRDGRTRLRIAVAQNANGITLGDHRNALLAGYAGASLHYTPKGAYWFVLSGTRGEEIFYHRVTLSCDRKVLHAWEVVFPAAERPVYEVIVDAMHRSYRHRNGPGARCGEPRREKAQPTSAVSAAPAPMRQTGRD